jgi:hypothetical protein
VIQTVDNLERLIIGAKETANVLVDNLEGAVVAKLKCEETKMDH